MYITICLFVILLLGGNTRRATRTVLDLFTASPHTPTNRVEFVVLCSLWFSRTRVFCRFIELLRQGP